MRDPLEFPGLFGLAEGLQVDSQLLTFLVQVTALQAQGARDIGHVEIVATDFRKEHFPFERFRAFRERP